MKVGDHGCAWKDWLSPCCAADGAIVEGKMDEGMDGVMEGDEGEGWDVGDELELPPDLVSSMVVVETIV